MSQVCLAMLVARAGLAVLAVSVILTAAAAAQSSAGSPPEDPLYRDYKDPAMIASQIRAALKPFERGVALLTDSPDADSTQVAVEQLLHAYRILRGAYEGNQLIQATAKFRDPLLDLQNRQILNIRWRLLNCTGKREYLFENVTTRTACLEGLAGGLHQLRMLIATLP